MTKFSFWEVSVLLFALIYVGCINSSDNTTALGGSAALQDKKIAFLFLTKGPLPLEDVWREFFTWRASEKHYTVYVHAHNGFKYPSSSFFHGKAIAQNVNVRWGGMSQVRAIKYLVRAALEDPLNEWFCLMSETCIPLIPFDKWRNILMANTKSVVNACAMSPGEMETEARWRPSLEQVGMKKSHWRKSATWFALNKKHATVFVNESALEPGWESVPCCDEHYLPSVLAYYGLDNETTCTDGFAHVNWPSLIASHPRMYNADEINAELFAYFERSVGAHAGFGQQCSGFTQICHFTARKFAPSTKYVLLENMDLILSEEHHPYTGNPWAHNQQHLRLSKLDGKYYMLEGSVRREVPDDSTFRALHLSANSSQVEILSPSEEEQYSVGRPFPSRADGLLYKLNHPKVHTVWIMKDGHRHAVPNLATFQSMNLSFDSLTQLTETDLEHIAMGPPIRSVE